MNATIKGRPSELKTIEFGARPTFYFYANFLTPGSGKNWMGDEDLCCATDDELRTAVTSIKRGLEDYRSLWKLQYVYMEGHDELAPGVYVTRYANGTKVYVNYTKLPFALAGEEATIPAEDWMVK